MGCAMVLWVTGLSGSGKTTLCRALCDLLKPRLPELVLLDGDEIRKLFGDDLDHTEPSRRIQIERLRRLSEFLVHQGQIVVVAALYSHADLSAANRKTLPGYFEIYLEASLDLVSRRDSKGLYAGAAAGRIPNVVGIDIPWHAPASADLVLRADAGTTPAEMALQVARRVPRLSAALVEATT